MEHRSWIHLCSSGRSRRAKGLATHLAKKNRRRCIMAASQGHMADALALFAVGADVSRRCDQFITPVMHLATPEGNLEVLRAVIEHGADVDATTRSSPFSSVVCVVQPDGRHRFSRRGRGQHANTGPWWLHTSSSCLQPAQTRSLAWPFGAWCKRQPAGQFPPNTVRCLDSLSIAATKAGALRSYVCT